MELIGAGVITFFNLFTIWFKMYYATEDDDPHTNADKDEKEAKTSKVLSAQILKEELDDEW